MVDFQVKNLSREDIDLAFVLRVFIGRVFRILCGLSCVQYRLSTAVATLFGCRPMSAARGLTIPGATCVNRPALYCASSVFRPFYSHYEFLTTRKLIFENIFFESSSLLLLQSAAVKASTPLETEERSRYNFDGWSSVSKSTKPLPHLTDV